MTGKRKRQSRAATRRVKRAVKNTSRNDANKRAHGTAGMASPALLQACASEHRANRIAETRRRNAQNQLGILMLKAAKRKTRSKQQAHTYAARQASDRAKFHEAIDAPIAFICGSCGELANARTMQVKAISRCNAWLRCLQIKEGGSMLDGLIPEAVVTHPKTKQQSVPFCEACMRSLRRRRAPKFSIASGFRLCDVPHELATLNTMECRLIGLGICFTTCYNLPFDGQECSKGNAINYWNDACKIVSSLPRPIDKCGVVHLRCKGDSTARKVFDIRPNLVRDALVWLVRNNPLYKEVEISEVALKDLEDPAALPTLQVDSEMGCKRSPVTSETTSEVEYGCSSVNSNGNDANTSFEDTFQDSTCPALESIDSVETNDELFHMDCGDQTKKTESEKVLDTVCVDLESRQDPINEYTEKTMMQCCFPTLFPDGYGGFHPIDGEHRDFKFDLAEYCAHLMAWHDRRFVMHRNFKFYCLNLIQRRQIAALTRKIPDRNAIQVGADGTLADQMQRAKTVLKELKPYFNVVRGSGLYWSNVRDGVMAMLGNDVLPTPFPTFFFTLSAADTIWPDVCRACDPTMTLEQAAHLPADKRRRLLNENPDVASKHFYRRFKAFFDHIICGESKPLGEVIDFFWRVEFQKRGSPHIHGLLWIRDAPDVLSLASTEDGRQQLAAFVDSRISASSIAQYGTESCLCSVCTSARDDPAVDILACRVHDSMTEQECQCDLARVVRRVQQHQCCEKSSCRSRNGVCRFDFPKLIRETTDVAVETADNGATRLRVECHRDNAFTNNYNSDLIQVWRANMDIKLVGNAYGAAEYTAAYVSKSEPDTTKFRELINSALDKCGPEMDHHRVLQRVANAALSAREVSAQEALWILQNGMPMYGKSRTIVPVKSTRHSQRFYRVDPQRVRDEMINGAAAEDAGISITTLEAAYISRPRICPFDDMSFKQFCEQYDPVSEAPRPTDILDRWQRIDGMGYIKARKVNQVVRKTPRWKPDDSCPNFCFSELLLRRSWRALEELPETDEDCVAQYCAFVEMLRGPTKHAMDLAVERANQLELLSSSQFPNPFRLPTPEWHIEQGLDDSGEDFQSCGPIPSSSMELSFASKYSADDILRAESFVEKVVKPFMKEREDGKCVSNGTSAITHMRMYQYPIGLRDDNMKDDQSMAFALCMRQSRLRAECLRTERACKPLTMILNGEGGCGKSWLISHIVKDVHHVFGEDHISARYSKRVLLLAHHGNAAFNIKGKTICSALCFSRTTGRGYDSPYERLSDTKAGPEKLRRLQDKYASVHMVIVDEYSVVSCGMLFWIDQRMREIWPDSRDIAFGGRDLILVGDLGQLSPVMPAALSTPIEQVQNGNQQKGRRLWLSMQHVRNLTSQSRGKEDTQWYEALGRLRRIEHTTSDIDLFNSRCSRFSRPRYSPDANFLAYKNDDVDEANLKMIRQQPSPVYTIVAEHDVQNKDPGCQDACGIPSKAAADLLLQATVPNATRDHTIPLSISLAVGAPVSLTCNLAQSAGLCNGTKALVYDFMPRTSSNIPIVLVQVVDKYIGPSYLPDVPNVVPIAPRLMTWSPKHSKVRTRRVGLPLRLAYAMTIHKVSTCPRVIFDPSGIPSSAFAYVALSRVRKRDDIVLASMLDIRDTPGQRKLKLQLTDEWNRLDQMHSRGVEEMAGIVEYFKHIAEAENASVLRI